MVARGSSIEDKGRDEACVSTTAGRQFCPVETTISGLPHLPTGYFDVDDSLISRIDSCDTTVTAEQSFPTGELAGRVFGRAVVLHSAPQDALIGIISTAARIVHFERTQIGVEVLVGPTNV